MADFHFLRPWWLLAIIVLIGVIQLLKRQQVSQSGWQKLIPQHLANVLVDGHQETKSTSWFIPFFIGTIAIIAMAGPSWQKLPQPVYQVAKGSVLIMDMSYSMYATDISPNRLTRARYKAIDLLDELKDGETGLIAYAGDAFTISPLTDDANNIKLLLPSLSPDLMPVYGSNPLSALVLADNMLTNAGYKEGDIYWFTDGIDGIDQQDLIDWLRAHAYRVNILGIGTQAGAPIKLNDGKLMKDDSGGIIVPKLTISALKNVAKQGTGSYVNLTNNNSDIEKLAAQPLIAESEEKKKNEKTGDQWQEFGPYLLLVIMPFVLGYFRRGILLFTLPFALLLSPHKSAYADLWQDLWQTKDQQAQQQFNQQAYQQAAENFNDPLWQGSSHYKAGDYEKALSAFQQSDSAQSLYNQGNALAKLQKLDEAIDAYQQALDRDPNLADAKANKELLEKLKQQQENQQQNEQSGENSENKQEQNQQQNQQGNNQEQQGQDQQSQDQKAQTQQNEQGNNKDQQHDQSQSSAQENTDDKEQEAQQQAAEQNQQSQKEEKNQSDAQAQQAQQTDEENEPKDQASIQAQQLAQQQAKETAQKHQQLLNKVTDDPYLLLRNKMQLEYQKRRYDNRNKGAKKKW